jgi:predicted transcriptional regulator
VIKPFVFSLRGVYISMFFDRRKEVEFRTRKPDLDPGDVVLLYETAPTSMVVASAVVGDILDDSPTRIWELTGDRGGITRAEFGKYFHNRGRAVALELKVTRLAEPLALPAGMSPPQAWARWKGEWPLP